MLRLIADGRTNTDIGRHLNIATDTVKTHVAHILSKLRAHNRAHAVAAGYQRGILP